MPERIYIMHKQLDELRDGGWRHFPQFEKFVESLTGVLEKSDSCADRVFVRRTFSMVGTKNHFTISRPRIENDVTLSSSQPSTGRG